MLKYIARHTKTSVRGSVFVLQITLIDLCRLTFTIFPLSVLCEMSLTELLKMLGLGAVAIALGLEGLDWLLARHLWPRRRYRQPLKEVLFFPSPPTCVEHLYNPVRAHPW